MTSTRTCHGLPWLSKWEKKIFDRQGYAAIYAAGPAPGRPIYVGFTGKLPDRMTAIKSECAGDFALHSVVWTEGDPLARRIMIEVEAILDKAKRRLRSNLFDVTPEFARKVVLFAADRAGVQIFTHDQMLARIRSIRQLMIDGAVHDTVGRVDWGGFEDGVKIDEGRAALDLPISGIS
ncbi:hypothetical protein [Bradyrhizobium sp. 8-10B]|uniref:hypothetical protein n=1 Tax=Bradyrhizobium sp. 8-10B TaxID=3344579 RepID=UPI0035BEFAAA